MTNQHPIAPPTELLDKWDNLPLGTKEIFVVAAQWGADQELEVCIDVLSGQREWDVLTQCIGWKDFRDQSEKILRAARRPKPMSRKERALEDLARIEATCGHLTWPETQLQSKRAATIRFALEALDD